VRIYEDPPSVKKCNFTKLQNIKVKQTEKELSKLPKCPQMEDRIVIVY